MLVAGLKGLKVIDVACGSGDAQTLAVTENGVCGCVELKDGVLGGFRRRDSAGGPVLLYAPLCFNFPSSPVALNF